MLDTTRVPVREAFQRLVAEGVLEHVKNRGHFVTLLGSAELEQLCWMRAALEDEVIRTTEWPNEAGFAKLRELADEVAMFASHERPYDYGKVTRADRKFHYALWALSPLTVIHRELVRVWRQTEPYYIYMPLSDHNQVANSVAEHESILGAIAARDRELYLERMVTHRSIARDFVEVLAAVEKRSAVRESTHRRPTGDDGHSTVG